jgi:chitin synthase
MWKYRTAIYILATLTVYMLVCAVLCIVKAFQQINNPIFARMIVSLLATYGVYVFASLIAMDPIHLLTSAGQYFLLQASKPYCSESN